MFPLHLLLGEKKMCKKKTWNVHLLLLSRFREDKLLKVAKTNQVAPNKANEKLTLENTKGLQHMVNGMYRKFTNMHNSSLHKATGSPKRNEDVQDNTSKGSDNSKSARVCNKKVVLISTKPNCSQSNIIPLGLAWKWDTYSKSESIEHRFTNGSFL